MEVITFKGDPALNAAILAVACNEGHGNKSKVITEILKANPAIQKEIKKSLKINSK